MWHGVLGLKVEEIFMAVTKCKWQNVADLD